MACRLQRREPGSPLVAAESAAIGMNLTRSTRPFSSASYAYAAAAHPAGLIFHRAAEEPDQQVVAEIQAHYGSIHVGPQIPIPAL